MIALITALVVMLAATLLITLTEKMVDSHSRRLLDSQIALSEASGADYIAFLLQRYGTASADESFTCDLAGVRTEFTLEGSSSADLRRGLFPVDLQEGAVLVPTGSGLAAASIPEEGLVTLVFYGNESFQPYGEISLETSMIPVAGTALDSEGETVLFLVLQGGGETMIAVCTGQQVSATAVFPGEAVSEGSMLTAALSSGGDPLLIITDGTNGGTLFDPLTGEFAELVSPPGTCPVFMEDGTLFGTVSDQGPVFSFIRIKDVFFGDFNSDGTQDAAFASPFALSAFSGATDEVFSSAPGGNLVCWGEIQGRSGLVGMWRTTRGEKWFRLGWDGFSEFVPEAALRLGWSGRFSGSGSVCAGFIDGTAVVASSSGYLRELFEGNAFTADLDGGYPDFLAESDEGLEAVYNPVSGEGITFRYSAMNYCRGEEYPGSAYLFSVYESGNGYSVYHTIDGTDR